MSTRRKRVGVALITCFVAASLVQAQTGDRPDLRPAREERDSHLIQWEPKARYASLRLVVVNREGLVHEQVFEAREPVFFEYVDRWGEPLPDGRYTYELRATPIVDPEVRAELATARKDGHLAAAKARLRAAGKLPPNQLVQSDSFVLKDGRLEPFRNREEGAPETPLFNALTVDSNWSLQSDAAADLQFLDKTVTPNRTAVEIENGGEDNRLYVAQSGNVGLGTSAPIEELHIVADDTPAIRLHQTAGAFPLQEWDLGCNLAGNETAFFVRDETNNKTPFQIEPGAPDASLYVTNDGNVGIGSTDPSDRLTLRDGNLRIESALFDSAIEWRSVNQEWHFLLNDTTGRMSIRDDTAGTIPFKLGPGAQTNLLRLGISASDRVDINGSLFINGVDNSNPDFVFEPDYPLESIQEHARYMWRNKHLLAVGAGASGQDGKARIDVAARSQGVLEELEKAHIYIEQLSKREESLNNRLQRLELESDQLRRMLDDLLNRLSEDRSDQARSASSRAKTLEEKTEAAKGGGR